MATIIPVSDTHAAALNRIPRLYSLALRLRAAGLSNELIVECLDIEPEAFDTVMRIAGAKLAAAEKTAGRWTGSIR